MGVPRSSRSRRLASHTHTEITTMSAFWTSKMATYFSRIDADKDGAITRNDFECMATRFIAANKLDAASGGVLQGKLCEIWDNFLKNVAGDAALDKTAFIAAMAKMVADPASEAALAGPLPLFFQAVDANNDGFIDAGEYGIFFDIIGIDKSLAADSFKAIDENNDGLLSADEFTTAGVQFFKSDDAASPNRLFWGPLIQ